MSERMRRWFGELGRVWVGRSVDCARMTSISGLSGLHFGREVRWPAIMAACDFLKIWAGLGESMPDGYPCRWRTMAFRPRVL